MSATQHTFTVYRGTRGSGKIQRSSTTRALHDDECLVRITASGLCGTDLHFLTAGIALGHEGVGVVAAAGARVASLRVGDRVGWGYVHATCQRCASCLAGRDVFCPGKRLYGRSDTDQGSLGGMAVWREAWLFRLPAGLADVDAAPLMCGGATVFAALRGGGRAAAVCGTETVGVVGVGGLGHLAIQFASKMGCRVIVFSGTDSKRREATRLGAHAFYATKDVEKLTLESPLDKCDVLLVTTSAQPDWKMYLTALKPEAKIFPLSVSSGNLVMPYAPILGMGLSIQGSMVATRAVHMEMLEFAARNNIKPVVQTFKMDTEGIEDAIKTLKEGRMRYRGVLVAGKEQKL